MKRLVFDIECVAEDWDSFDQTTKDSLTRYARDVARDEVVLEHVIEQVKHELVF